MGIESISLGLSLDTISATVRRAKDTATAVREIGPPGINVERITDLQRLGRCIGVQSEPGDIAVKLGEIESKAPWYSNFQIAVAVGVASGAFAFLNGAAAAEMFATAIGCGVGQLSRSWLSGRQF